MNPLREHPQVSRWAWCPAAPLTGDGGEERSAYSSDKVVKFGGRGVSHGLICRLKALKAAYIKIYVCQIMEFVEQATVLGALIPRFCRNFRSSPLFRVSR